jgi:glutathione S-transferase
MAPANDRNREIAVKLHDFKLAPSPRRVRIFLAEKGLEVDTVQVNLREREQFGEAYRAINPWCTVPALELDDGTCISEIDAICRYFEDTHPDPPLMGVDSQDRAVVTMWNRRLENDGFGAALDAFRNSSPRMENRALTGPHDVAQIAALAERSRGRIERLYALLDGRLAENEFIAGPRFSIADITALVTIDFATRFELEMAPDQAHLKRWYDQINARPSAQA